jgi:hypothetical protein
MRTKIRLKIRLKLYENGRLVLDTTRRKKSQIMLQLERVFHDKSYIQVSYPCGGWNDSCHSSDELLKAALSAYTEKSMIDELTNL